MPARPASGTVDKYIARYPAEVQAVLEELRSLIKAAAPGTTETISYGIPTFDLDGKHVVHFAGWKNHTGMYPTPSAMGAFAKDLEPYRSGKGSIQFPLDKPLPKTLIKRIVKFRMKEVASAKKGK